MGSIRDLEGIQIKVDLPPSAYVYFQVGWIAKRLAVDDFRGVQSCQDRTTFQDKIRRLFPEPRFELEDLITGDIHVSI
ncbi:unnamed protein product [Spirodela intermedia]|uniref:Uncharacterized protein n=2 Tax=Spirodela intermedia TaxID=51605 RepID=A0A7I8J0A5_SPIIN|nr:unnamed protein product [Spirodela intermedia]CAA6662861.1 unnamed protein product [Spirodela intermedia]CAA7399271.1 unnamed protein product [Spirodela intermedia]